MKIQPINTVTFKGYPPIGKSKKLPVPSGTLVRGLTPEQPCSNSYVSSTLDSLIFETLTHF